MFAIQKNIALAPHTTFSLTANAAQWIELTDKQDLPEICKLPEFDLDRVCWLGGGSNILFIRDFPDLVVKMATRGISEVGRNGDSVLIEAQAGENWHEFVLTTLNMGLSGLENLSLIPGTVGASPVQNIGAYGVEIKDRIHSIQCFDLEKQEFIMLLPEQCAFAYRDSLFKHTKKFVIVAVTFALSTQFVAQVKYGDLAEVLTQK